MAAWGIHRYLGKQRGIEWTGSWIRAPPDKQAEIMRDELEGDLPCLQVLAKQGRGHGNWKDIIEFEHWDAVPEGAEIPPGRRYNHLDESSEEK